MEDLVIQILAGLAVLAIGGIFTRFILKPLPIKDPVPQVRPSNARRQSETGNIPKESSGKETITLGLNENQLTDLQAFLSRDTITPKALSLGTVTYEIKGKKEKGTGQVTFQTNLPKGNFRVSFGGVAFEDLLILETERIVQSSKEFVFTNAKQHAPLIFRLTVNLGKATGLIQFEVVPETFPIATVQRWMAFLKHTSTASKVDLQNIHDPQWVFHFGNLQLTTELLSTEDLNLIERTFQRLQDLIAKGVLKNRTIDLSKTDLRAMENIRKLHDLVFDGVSRTQYFSITVPLTRWHLLRLLFSKAFPGLTPLAFEFSEYREVIALPSGESVLITDATYTLRYPILQEMGRAASQFLNPLVRILRVPIGPKNSTVVEFRANLEN